MRLTILPLLALVLCACSPSEPPPAPQPTVQEAAAAGMKTWSPMAPGILRLHETSRTVSGDLGTIALEIVNDSPYRLISWRINATWVDERYAPVWAEQITGFNLEPGAKITREFRYPVMQPDAPIRWSQYVMEEAMTLKDGVRFSVKDRFDALLDDGKPQA